MIELVMESERRTRLARAELRQLEQDTGQSASADGRYWLIRTAALERLVPAAECAVKGDVEPLKRELEVLRRIATPACNPNDHKERA